MAPNSLTGREFLERILTSDLRSDERNRIQEVLDGRLGDPERVVPEVIRGLIRRGCWRLADEPADSPGFLVVEDRDRKERYRIRRAFLDDVGAETGDDAGAADPIAAPNDTSIDAPGDVRGDVTTTVRGDVPVAVQGDVPKDVPNDAPSRPQPVPLPSGTPRLDPLIEPLLALPGQLVSYDRILGPKEVITRLEAFFVEHVPCAAADFHPLELPGSNGFDSPKPNGLPLSVGEMRELALHREHMLEWHDGAHHLLIGMGDDLAGWSGCLLLTSNESIEEPRRAIILSAVHHFSRLISTVIRLQGLIFYDFLTGIYNRSYYEDQIDREIQMARRRKESMALLLVDIDSFKAFNTRFGYEGGDRVLATTAMILKSALRGTDTLARYGGEEFVIILAPPVSPEEASMIAERLRKTVADELYVIPDLEGRSVETRVTVSMGGALYPKAGETPHALWTVANREVLRAKEAGKNRVSFG